MIVKDYKGTRELIDNYQEKDYSREKIITPKCKDWKERVRALPREKAFKVYNLSR